TCFECRKKYIIDGVLVSSAYKSNGEKTLLAKIVHYYKYRFISELNIYLGEILKKSLLNSSLPLPDAIVPVPLHSRRLRWRGFNQSEMLCYYLASRIAPGLEISVLKNALIRKKYTIPQMKIKNRRQRERNLKGVFLMERKFISGIKGKNILLVDDIATTGSTLFECAKVLKKKGAKKVYGIVLARE
ncbi:MAG: phosphoribosyltransferase family protein, partial [Parcubacteria group bacterium]